jgi:hypothetical protein
MENRVQLNVNNSRATFLNPNQFGRIAAHHMGLLIE